MNSFGNIYRFTTFGESHGPAIGGIIDGVPAGIDIDIEHIQHQLDRRKPGNTPGVSPRREDDQVEILSGIYNGVTLGSPIGFIIRNKDHRPGDYGPLSDIYRPGHADFTYQTKYGLRDHRGGGRSSARETACRVVAGAIALQIIELSSITIKATIADMGGIPHPTQEEILDLTTSARRDGNTLGGIIECTISGAPAGLGEPVYAKLSAMLSSAMMSINAAKGVEIGLGFDYASLRGPEANDPFTVDANGVISTATNHCGGILGGISTGNDITLRIAFKPIATCMRTFETITHHGDRVTVTPRGRHDVSALPRALPVVEAMAACVMLDAVLMNRNARL